MLWSIAKFEFRRRLHSLSTYIYFALFFAISLLYFIMAAGISANAGGKVFANSPYFLNAALSSISYLGLLVTAAVMGQAVYQDFELNTYPLFFTSPISKWNYLGGRFLGAFLILLFIYSSILLGCLIGSWTPFVEKSLIGPNRAAAYLQPYLTCVIPNLFLTGVVFFSLAALTQKIRPVYVCSVIFLIGYLIANTLTQGKLEQKSLAALIDPFGFYAMGHLTEYWTIIEKNTLLIPLEGIFLLNRILWITLAVMFFGLTLLKFRFAHISGAEGAARTQTTVVNRTPSTLAIAIKPTKIHPLRLLPHLTWLLFKETVKNIYFFVIVLAGILFMVFAALNLGSMYGTSTYPVTYSVLEIVGGSFGLFFLIIIIFYSGELVWREREARTDQLFDVLPIPTWLPFASKLMALILVQVLLLFFVMISGITIQAFQGYFQFEFGLYIQNLFGIQFVHYALLSTLAMTIQVIVNHKYLGHFIMVFYYLLKKFMPSFGFKDHLYLYGTTPSYTYSEMNGFGHFIQPIAWFNLYWAACAVLLAILSSLLWIRGTETSIRIRLSAARSRLSPRLQMVTALMLVAFASVGGFIFYNTNVLNSYKTAFENDKESADYEKNYKLYQRWAQPRISDVKVAFDLFPEVRDLKAKGSYTLQNKTQEMIYSVFVRLPSEVKIHKLSLDSLQKATEEDKRLGFYTFMLKEPIKPGDMVSLTFDLEYEASGFKNDNSNTDIVYNGTFFNNEYLPHIGYHANVELSDDNTRRRHGLLPKERMADVNNLEARRNNYISNDCDWMTFETTLSTSLEQIAIAPGYLQREWQEGGRRYFHYKGDGKILGFFAVLSARYKVLVDKWHDVAIEIFYHRGHEYNLNRMVKSIKASLDYFTANFSPYQHKQVRILEFPRYNAFAQSFPNTIPYSEAIGFIAKVDPTNEDDIDYPFYITAHEVAHQWWAHQVIGGNVQGATMLSETLAQYSALMVMKKEFGADKMKRFLRYELNQYLVGRSVERKKELPLIRVENQPYIYYNKGSLVMYALQDYIGEATVNQALSNYLNAVAYQEPPYTNSLELLDYFKRATPKEMQYLIEDLFETITLYENRALSATYSELSKEHYEVRLSTTTKKFRAGELGEEQEIPVNDLIDIGILDAEGNWLYLEKHRINQEKSEFSIIVSKKPAKAGIDPMNKLIDRRPDDHHVNVERSQTL